uniref:Uncharacterized protein n=1 Tax=viral metagenome TaxID=1070528 RepID=A0A6C0KDK1_9ZZZZ
MTTLILMDDDAINPHPQGLAIDDNIIFMLDQTHPNFTKNTDRAIQYGFRHPLLSTKFLDASIKGKMPHLFMYHKYNNDYGNPIDSEKQQANKKHVNFCISNYKKTQEDLCSLNVILSEEARNYLHDYSKTYRFKMGNGGHDEQREVSGRFFLFETVPNTFLVTVDKDTANLGGKEETASIDTLASFHTHPLDAYHKYRVCMAWPSVDDYCVFLGIYANGFGMFHILGTVEGIYVITISDRLAKEGREKIKNNFQYYEKQIKDHYHVNYPTCNIQEDAEENENVWSKKIEKYLDTMNSKKYFYVQFILWKDADKPINITYNSIDNNCMLSDEQIKFNNLLKEQHKKK